MAINQAGSLSVDQNDVNTGETNDGKNTVTIAKEIGGRENAIAIETNIKNKEAKEPKKSVNFAVKNEEMGEPNKNAKVGLKI